MNNTNEIDTPADPLAHYTAEVLNAWAKRDAAAEAENEREQEEGE